MVSLMDIPFCEIVVWTSVACSSWSQAQGLSAQKKTAAAAELRPEKVLFVRCQDVHEKRPMLLRTGRLASANVGKATQRGDERWWGRPRAPLLSTRRVGVAANERLDAQADEGKARTQPSGLALGQGRARGGGA